MVLDVGLDRERAIASRLGAAILLLAGALSARAAESERALALSAFDGDTLVVSVGERRDKVRLLGVDTPEKAGGGRPAEPFWDDAARLTRALAVGREVELESDAEAGDRDRYGRLLRYVRLPDGRVLNEELLRAGLAFVYRDESFARRDVYERLELEARRAGRGAWDPASILHMSWDEAPHRVGAVAAVHGRIVASKRTERICFLNFDPDYERQLTVVIFDRDLDKFPASPEKAFLDREVEVVGRIVRYRGRPEIVVTEPDEIRTTDDRR